MLSRLAAQRLANDPDLAERARLLVTTMHVSAQAQSSWTVDGGIYLNRENGRPYTPHHNEEHAFVYNDAPRRALCKGGEGSGKSVAGIIKDLERLRRGMHGIMGSPDFEHFKRSLWPEFRRWCPWGHVTARHQYKAAPDWEPTKPFTLAFENGATLLCGGFDDPSAWEGPNVHFSHWDEARRHKSPHMLKVLDGRCRLVGPKGEPPQLHLTSTPLKHWLYEYFGPWEKEDEVDPFADFKRETLVITLRTADNEAAGHLWAGYTAIRRQSLSEAEARVNMDAEWEDLADAEPFLPSMILWDNCREQLAPPDRRTPLVVAADAGVSGDCFALIGTSRHPQRRNDVAVRLVDVWEPKGGKQLDYDRIEEAIVIYIKALNIIEIAYDPYQLHQMMMGLRNRGLVKTKQFDQGADRLIADYQLLQLAVRRGIAHDGHALLRQHVANANRKAEAGDRERLRIVKRTPSLKIDACVATSMSAFRCLKLPL